MRYVASQPWPFPHSLMVGFRARYVSGELVLDDDEIVDARWYRRDDLPMLPGPISIARKLIDAWLTPRVIGADLSCGIPPPGRSSGVSGGRGGR